MRELDEAQKSPGYRVRIASPTSNSLTICDLAFSKILARVFIYEETKQPWKALSSKGRRLVAYTERQIVDWHREVETLIKSDMALRISEEEQRGRDVEIVYALLWSTHRTIFKFSLGRVGGPTNFRRFRCHNP